MITPFQRWQDEREFKNMTGPSFTREGEPVGMVNATHCTYFLDV